jgi:hypothetical protein
MRFLNNLISPPIPEPELILMGCQPWDALDRATCPVCRGRIPPGQDRTYCARCDGSSPRVETRVLAARLDVRIRGEIERAHREAHDEFLQWRRSAPQLSESERRRIWLGYSPSGIRSKNPQVVNRAKVGRDWLIAIDQVPDWTLKLDRNGQVVGRYESPRNPEESA